MNEAPERIYSGPSVDDKGVFWDVGHWDKEPDEGCIEYVRADRIEKLEANLAKANDHIEGLEELLWAAEKDASEAEAYAGELEAKLAKAVKLIELAIELGRWELNPSFRDELIAFTAELTSSEAAYNEVKGGKDE